MQQALYEQNSFWPSHLVWTLSLVHSLVSFLQMLSTGFSLCHIKGWWNPPLCFCASDTNNTSCFTSAQAVLIHVLSPAFIHPDRSEESWNMKCTRNDLHMHILYIRHHLLRSSDILGPARFVGSTWDVLAWPRFYVVWKAIRGSQHLQVP